MRGYEDDLDEYDEYEEEGEEQEEEEEGEEQEEEERKPTQEELEYLELRQRLKDSIRKKMKKEDSSALMNSHEKKRKLPYDNYGSFFGPSQPVISQRVIQESKSLLENQHMASTLLTSNHGSKKTSASNSTGYKNRLHVQPPKVISEVKKKVEKLKDTRDYSFLISDDTELPAPSKVSLPRKIPILSSEARSAHMPLKSKRPLGISGRNTPSGHEEKKPVSLNGQMHSRSGSVMHSKSGSTNGQVHSKSGSTNSQTNSKYGLLYGQTHSKSETYRSASANKSNSTTLDARKQLASYNGIGPGRPVVAKPLPPKAPVAIIEKKTSASGAKNHMLSVHKPQPSKMHSSDPKQRLEQRKGSHEASRAKTIQKQSATPSKPQINKPLKQISSRDTLYDHRPKKKPVKASEDEMALSMIRSMFNTQRYADCSDDDSDMEANFDDIMKEEKRSARIARKEDEEQLRLIEEEERRERMRKMRKLNRN